MLTLPFRPQSFPQAGQIHDDHAFDLLTKEVAEVPPVPGHEEVRVCGNGRAKYGQVVRIRELYRACPATRRFVYHLNQSPYRDQPYGTPGAEVLKSAFGFAPGIQRGDELNPGKPT